MRQRKPPAKRRTPNFLERRATQAQEERFYNLEGREWLKRQIGFLGRGRYLLKKWGVRTIRVKRKAVELSHGKTAIAATKSMINFVSKIQFEEVADVVAAKFYGKQTADDIVAGKKIPTFRGGKSGIIGCQTFCATLVALLRSSKHVSGKIRDVRVVRTITPYGPGKEGQILGMPHTIVTLSVDGVRYVADPFKLGHSFIGSKWVGKKGMLIKETEIQSKVDQLKKQNTWREAYDPSEFGINSFAEYVNESRRTGRDLTTQFNFEEFLRNLKDEGYRP